MFTFPLDVCKKWWEHSVSGNRSAESNENHTCTTTDELRTYKIHLVGKIFPLTADANHVSPSSTSHCRRRNVFENCIYGRVNRGKAFAKTLKQLDMNVLFEFGMSPQQPERKNTLRT